MATFTLNQFQQTAVQTLERLIFLLSIFLNLGSESYLISLLVSHQDFSNSDLMFITIIFVGIISDLLSLIGSAIYLSSKHLHFYPFVIVLINWIRVSPTLDIWCQSYSTDIFKIVMGKKRETLRASFSFGKLEAMTAANIMKTVAD